MTISPSLTYDRIPPRDERAEQAVLGACVLSDEARLAVLSWLRPGEFYFEPHQHIFELLQRQDALGAGFDFLSLKMAAERAGVLEACGGLNGLMSVCDSLVWGTSSANRALDYARKVRDAAALRGLIQTCREVSALAYEPSADSTELATRLHSQALAALDPQSQGQVDSSSELAVSVWQSITAAAEGQPTHATPTGVPLLDFRTGGGLRPGELWTLAARPRVGKTSLAACMALHAARAGHAVVFLSLEMPPEQIMLRLYAQLMGVGVLTLRTSQASAHMDQASEALGALSQLPIQWIGADALGSATPASVGLLVRRVQNQETLAGRKVGLVILDQLNKVCEERYGRLQDDLYRTVVELKRLTLKLQVPLLVLHQLNRAPEIGKREPTLADLRDTGAVEQESDGVMFLHRKQEDEPMDRSRTYPVNLLVAKHRMGAEFRIPLQFDPQTTRFAEEMKR